VPRGETRFVPRLAFSRQGTKSRGEWILGMDAGDARAAGCAATRHSIFLVARSWLARRWP